MDKSVRYRVLDSFRDTQTDGSGKEQAREYSERVYAVWKDTSASLSRSALLIFLLIAVFELLVYQRTSTSISIGTITLVNSSIVQIALPTVVAFVFYDGARLSARWLRLELIYMELMKIYAIKQQQNGLDRLIEPNLPSLWGIGALSYLQTGDIADSFIHQVNRIVSYTIILALPVAFECQAFYRLTQKFGYHNIFLWINAVITVLFGVCTALYAWYDRAERSTWWDQLQSDQ
jgi:hypothetical protein